MRRITLFKQKNGSAYYLIYGLFFLLVVGLLYVVFNQIVVDNIRPILDSPSLNFSDNSREYGDKYLGIWKLMPYILVFIVMIFFVLWIGVYNRGGF